MQSKQQINEYVVNVRVTTEWHNPYNTITHNDYTEFVEAETAKQAAKKAYLEYAGVLTNPNKDILIRSIKKL